jgi:hypothetical protein
VVPDLTPVVGIFSNLATGPSGGFYFSRFGAAALAGRSTYRSDLFGLFI